MEDITESCSSRAVDSCASSPFSDNSRKLQRQKADIYLSVVCKLKELNVEEAWSPEFEDDLWAHFQRLPLRYALDVDVERAEDVLMHKRLLAKARDPTNRPAIEVRLVEVPSSDTNLTVPDNPNSPREATSRFSNDKSLHSKHPLPTCGLQCSREVKLEGTDSLVQYLDNSSLSSQYSGPMHEIMISSNDKRKFLSQFTSLMSEIELNIREAHAFCTIDGYSLDVFFVDGWKFEETQKLRTLLTEKMQKIESTSLSMERASVNTCKQELNGLKDISNHVNVPACGKDDWEIDVNLLYFEKKIAYGSYGELYKGTYHDQDVAIKFILAEHLSNVVLQEFTQEVSIMRRIHHRNIVQFIGACTRPPKLCVVTEYMPGGSVFNFLRKQKGVLKLSTVLRLAIDVSKGMSYLHRKNIIHRDLKAANLLMDENNVVKVADFGVAKVKTQTGMMTAETGTYRWMAPEVIGHKPYDHKVDVFSFGIVLWELLTGKIPYEDLTPLQAALGVVHKGLRPPIPRNTHPEVQRLLNLCWQQEPYLRPEFSEILEFLQHLTKIVYDDHARRNLEGSSSLSIIKV